MVQTDLKISVDVYLNKNGLNFICFFDIVCIAFVSVNDIKSNQKAFLSVSQR